MSAVKDKITTFVRDYFVKESGLVLQDDTSFLEEGVIDSVGVLELVAFIEETFAIRVEDEKIIPDNFDTNSTNCLLNSFANVVHEQRPGFNPYTLELANLVREGYMDRITALKRLNQQEDPEVVAMVKEKLAIGSDS